MTKNILQEFKTWLEHNAIEDVECATCDMAGSVCGKTLPVDEFLDGLMGGGVRLPESFFGLTVTGDFCFGGVLDDAEPDITFIPDPKTLRPVPWCVDKTAIVLGDYVDHGGAPVSFAPRRVLQRVLELYESAGWTPIVAPEFEFYLVSKPKDFHSDFQPPAGLAGLGQGALHPYGLEAAGSVEDLLNDLYTTCEAQNIPIGTLTQEAGPGQYELNLSHRAALEAADMAFLFKRTLHRVALDHGLIATFMAKPYEHSYGSAMHLHQNVLDAKRGANLFSLDGADMLRAHIAGLQHYLPRAMPLLAPYPNSYRRFAPGLSCPVNFHWGEDNRSVGLRVPKSNAKSRRIENRVPGADVNPYLVIAASLGCGYLGMKEGLAPDEPVMGGAYESDSQALPMSLDQALTGFAGDDKMKHLFSAEFVKLFSGIKRYELDEFNRLITPWEREHLLMKV